MSLSPEDMVTAAGIALRCMTYGSEETCVHAARARACPILLSNLVWCLMVVVVVVMVGELRKVSEKI